MSTVWIRLWTDVFRNNLGGSQVGALAAWRCASAFRRGALSYKLVRAMSSKTILWDVMDTLVVDPFRDVMPSFFGITLEQMLRDKHPTAWGRFERGELGHSEFLATFFEDGRSFDTRELAARIRASYRWIAGIESLLGELSAAGVAMHTLSNYPEWYLWIEERLGVSRYVEWSFVSCRTGLRKPDAAAFQLALTQLGRRPDECLFIDDRRGNCEAARALGLPSIHFLGDVSALRRELADLGVLAGSPRMP
jgi:HAD superfamily hydrolase (TIGR01509 family)